MKTEERINQWKLHDSIRGQFSFELYKMMAENKDIILLTGDLGYKIFDAHKEDMPDQYINCGASEQAMLGIAVGMAYEKKIPIVYSITPFLIYRPFETLRTYINHEDISVKLVGSGANYDYKHDGMSHFAHDTGSILSTLQNIKQHYPKTKKELIDILPEFISSTHPVFLSLKR